jgi:hypothetical protein
MRGVCSVRRTPRVRGAPSVLVRRPLSRASRSHAHATHARGIVPPDDDDDDDDDDDGDGDGDDGAPDGMDARRTNVERRRSRTETTTRRDATTQRSAAQTDGRRTTDDGRLTRRTTDDANGRDDGTDAPRPPRVVLDAYCLRIYKYIPMDFENIPGSGGVEGGGDARTDGCVRAWSACVRAMDGEYACACACAW